MRWLCGVLCAAFSCASAGCSGGVSVAAVESAIGRPAEAPDVLLLSVSGRTFDIADFFCPPDCNVPYLSEPGDAAGATFNDLVGRGYTVVQGDYTAAFRNFDDTGNGLADRYGLQQLLADLEWVHANWIDGFLDPTRIVIVTHSHGAVWAHIAASLLPDVPIEVLVSLDGVCLQWEDDHAPSILDFYAEEGLNPFPWDISAPCDRWDVAGVAALQDTEDVVFANIALNLEVQSNGGIGGGGVEDLQDNHRKDGSQDGIRRFKSGSDDHTEVHDPGRGSYQWVLTELALVFD